nr:MAG TPA: hypothetical protein [Bacteriophage sp.]
MLYFSNTLGIDVKNKSAISLDIDLLICAE